MKAGGNSAAGLALNCKVGSSAATLAKYQSRAALDYKAKLQARSKADKAAHPTDPFVAFTPSQDEEIVIPAISFQQAAAPTKTPQTSSAPSFNAPPQRKAGLGKATKLGAVKAIDVDFDQMDSHVWDDQSSAQTTSTVEPAAIAIAAPVPVENKAVETKPEPAPIQAAPAPAKKAPTMSKAQEAAVGRLGMGMKKLSLAQAQQNAPAEAPKSVSSEQFFKQSNPEEEVAVQEKLRNIRGQSSISSSDFFANPDEQSDDREDEEYRSSSGTLKSTIPFIII